MGPLVYVYKLILIASERMDTDADLAHRSHAYCVQININ